MLPLRDLLFVGVQGILFISFLWVGPWTFTASKYLAFPALAIGILGIFVLLLSLLQLNRNLSPFPSPRLDGELITSGLYKYIRHPIYTGILLAAVGFGLYTGSIFRIIIAVFLLILFYYKSDYEEKLLSKRFEKYEQFKLKTGRFLPRL